MASASFFLDMAKTLFTNPNRNDGLLGWIWISGRTVLTHPCVRGISTSVCVKGRNDELFSYMFSTINYKL
jgi:hypothetical protein